MMITPALLKSWNPCPQGYRRFLDLMPDGAPLDLAMKMLIKDGHSNWAWWLFLECRNRGLFQEITSQGFRNSGGRNSGDGNSGDWNSGDGNSGDGNSGDGNSGHWNSGDGNSGDGNSGDGNSGHWNSGGRNSGGRNSGDGNSGHWNSGHWNSGGRNSGGRNSGDGNSGHGNSGDWNSGDWNSGHFNRDAPPMVRVFERDISRTEWDAAYKPAFLFFALTEWADSGAMTEEEKTAHPEHTTTGGFLRTLSYKEAFRKSWQQADPHYRMKVKNLPNFDAEIFFDISGIDLRDGGHDAR